MVASAPILAVPIPGTKLYIPPPRAKIVVRTRLIERLNERVRVSVGGTPGVTPISAPAGFGKTTLASVWSLDLRLLLNQKHAHQRVLF